MAEVEFFGDKFEVLAVSQFGLLEFSEALEDAQSDESETAVGAAIMKLLRQIIPTSDWKRFAESARMNMATAEKDLMPLIQRAVEAADERPTELSSDSSGGQRSTLLKSASPAERRVIESESGRPDRQMGIVRSLSA